MATQQHSSQRRSFGDWFVLGMGAGALYSLWRNPQGCACCGCLVVVLALVLGVLVVGLVMSAWQFIVVIVVVVVVLKALQPTIEERFREWKAQRKGR